MSAGSLQLAARCGTARASHSRSATASFLPRMFRADLPFLPQRLSLLFLRAARGLWQQSALRAGTSSVRRLGGIHVPSSGHADFSCARRPARRGRRTYRDHGRNSRRGEGSVGHRHERRQPFGGSVAVLGAGPLGLCHLIKAKLLGAGKIYRDGSIRVPPPCRRGVRGDQ